MVELLIQTLEPLGFPVKKQGSILEDEPYPDSFFTFWNDSSDGTSFYSNTEGAVTWAYSINFYSTDPFEIEEVLIEAKQLLKTAGFIVTGAGHDIYSDEPTHTGRGITAYYFEKNKEV